MSLSGTHEDYTDEGATVESLATSVHEHMHLFQTLLSGYGHVVWDMRRQLTSYAIDEWRRMAVPEGQKRRLPMAHSAKVSGAHFVAALTVSEAARAQMTVAQARFLVPSSVGTRVSDLGIVLLRVPWETNPTITIDGHPHILQGKEILEGHAFFVERTLWELRLGYARDAAWSRDGVPGVYTVALDWFLETCGEWRRAAFPLVCDLALQTTHDPALPGTEEEWRAASPSWRFVRLSVALSGRPELSFDEDRLAECYGEFSDALLKDCGFKSIVQVLDERWSVLHRRLPLLGLERLMVRAVEMRRATPWLAVNPIRDEALWATMLRELPVPAVSIRGGLGRFGADESLESEFIIELQYQALGLQVLGMFSPAAVREKAIECGFSKFDIPQGCDYQRTAFCTGRYRTVDGPPHPLAISENGDFTGCPFEALLRTIGLTSTDLEIDHTAELPDLLKIVEGGP